MTEKQVDVGNLVTTTYKTGKYIAEVMEFSGEKALVKIAAVLRHPTQGDLHYPGVAENVMFQERRALAHNEKTWVHPKSLQLYDGEVALYEDSLKKALESEIDKLRQKGDAWSERSIEQLEGLRNDYFKGRR